MLSAARNKAAICRLLLSAGADAELLDRSGRNALSIAHAVGAHEAAEAILAAGATEDMRSEEGSSGRPPIEADLTGEVACSDPPAANNSVEPPLQPARLVDGDSSVITVIGSLPGDDESGFDLTGWEAEEEKAPPDDDRTLATDAFGVQTAISVHEPIDTSFGWDDFEAFLPDRARTPPHADNAEARDQLRLLLLGAVREGSVQQSAIDGLSCSEDGTPDREAAALLRMVVHDLGAKIVERFEYSAPRESFVNHVASEETPDEEDAVSEALVFIEDLAARRNEPMRMYQRDFQRIALLTAEGEVSLAQAMELSIDRALDALASWPWGLSAVLDAAAEVACGAKPLRWISSAGTRPESSGSDFSPSADFDVESEVETIVTGAETDEDRPMGHDDGEPVDDLEAFNTSTARLAAIAVGDCSSLNDIGWRERRGVLVQLSLTRSFLDDLHFRVSDSASKPALAFLQAMSHYRASRDRMAVANLKLVHSIAKKYIYSGEPLDDLLQEGNIGLLKAVDRFDWRKGFKFSTYATWWIRQQIGRHIPDRAKTIRLPVHVYEKTQRIDQVARTFELKHGVAPTSDAIATLLGISVSKVDSLLKSSIEPQALQDVRALDELMSDDVRDRLMAADPSDATEEIQLTASVRSSLAILEPKVEEIIRMRFGIGAGEAMTLEEVGTHFGLTRERIRQIEAKALIKLKRYANRDWLLTDSSGGLPSHGCRRALPESDSLRDDLYLDGLSNSALERTAYVAR
jgi:RNA polymerase primary sigma factor